MIAGRASSNRWLWGSVFALVAFFALAIILVWGPLRPRLLANHARYLTNAGQYRDALDAWSDIGRRYPSKQSDVASSDSQPLNNEAWTLHQAIEHWRNSPPDPKAHDFQEFSTFFDLADSRPALQREAQQGRLDILPLCEPFPTSATVAAARAILHVEYDETALWWLARLQYDPAQPMAIPPEVLRFRPQIEQPPAASQSVKPAEATRLQFLQALLALDRKDWAGAAAHLDQFQHGLQHLSPPPVDLGEKLNYVQGLALALGGRANEASTPLKRFIAQQPHDSQGLAALFQTYWELKQIPWAATIAAQLAQVNPTLMGEAWSNLCNSVLQARSRSLGVTPEAILLAQLAGWTGLKAPTGAGWQDLQPNLTSAPLSLRLRFDCIEQMIEQRNFAAAHNLARGLDESTTATTGSLAAALDRCLGWLEQSRSQAANPHPNLIQPLSRKTLNELLTRAASRHFSVEVPAGANLMLLITQGYVEGGVWPLLCARGGSAGATWYLADSRAAPRALLLPAPASGSASSDIMLSLLNPSENGGRAILLADIYFF